MACNPRCNNVNYFYYYYYYYDVVITNVLLPIVSIYIFERNIFLNRWTEIWVRISNKKSHISMIIPSYALVLPIWQPQSPIDASSHRRRKALSSLSAVMHPFTTVPHTSSTRVSRLERGPKSVMGFRFWVPILSASEPNERVKFSLGQTMRCCRGLR